MRLYPVQMGRRQLHQGGQAEGGAPDNQSLSERSALYQLSHYDTLQWLIILRLFQVIRDNPDIFSADEEIDPEDWEFWDAFDEDPWVSHPFLRVLCFATFSIC